MTTQQIAQAWREEHNYIDRGGVVVIYEGEVCGWVDELRDPQSWTPGCVAVEENGDCYEAIGGDDFGGADAWVLV